MNSELKKRIPKIPHWRFILLSGRDHPEYSDEMAQLDEYIASEKIDVGLGKSEDPEFHEAVYIYSLVPVRNIMNNLLIERCPPKVCRDVLLHKFNIEADTKTIKRYKSFFFDTDVLNTYEIAGYFYSNGHTMPKAPPVPGSMRGAYAGHKEGADVELDMDKAIVHMFNSAFFRAQELEQYGWEADDKVIKYRNQAMNMYKTIKENNTVVDLPDEFNYEIEYPEQTSVSADELEGYEP